MSVMVQVSHHLFLAVFDFVAFQIKTRLKLYNGDLNYCRRFTCPDDISLPINALHFNPPPPPLILHSLTLLIPYWNFSTVWSVTFFRDLAITGSTIVM